MRRFRVRVDANHKAIADALTAAGCTVQSLHSVGAGCPDLLVGRNGVNLLMEVKKVGPRGGMSSGARRSLTGEQEWAERWRGGRVIFVTGPQEALYAVAAPQEPWTDPALGTI
jgi:hypothetical protein